MSLENANKLRALGILVPHSKTAGQHKLPCPMCSKNAKHKNKLDLSVDLDSGMFRCHNTPECNYKGYVNKITVPEKTYTIPTPPANHTGLHPDVVAWFANRGISQQTLIKQKVIDGWAYFHAKGDIPAGNQWAMMFPYYEKEQLVNIKYRSAFKQFTFHSGAKLVFYNIDSIAAHDWCVICEGEIDALTFIQAGIEPVVSVPNGASAGSNQRLEFLDNCWEAFENKNKIILALDDDEPGRALRAELIRRFGAERCYTVQYAPQFKDINEHVCGRTLPDGTVLPGMGILSVQGVIDSAQACPVKGIKRAKDFATAMMDLFRNGFKPGVSIGIRDSDTNEELVTFKAPQLIIVTGIPSHGKSSGIDEIMVKLAIQHGWRFGVFSPENHPLEEHIAKLIEIIIGKPFGPIASDHGMMTEQEIIAALEFIDDHFYFVIEEDVDSFGVDDVLNFGEILVKKYGIQAFVIDPWNTLEHDWGVSGNETAYINRSLKKIVMFNRKFNLITFLVAHPEKMKKPVNKLEYPIPTLYNISGSANWANRADIGMCWYRNFKDGTTMLVIQKMRHKRLGVIGTAKYMYNKLNGRFMPQNGVKDRNNWLISKPIDQVQPALNFNATPEIITGDNNHGDNPF